MIDEKPDAVDWTRTITAEKQRLRSKVASALIQLRMLQECLTLEEAKSLAEKAIDELETE